MPRFLGNHLGGGQFRHVLQHRLAAIAEARRLHRAALQRAADVIDDQGRQRLALDVFSDDQEGPARFCDLLEQRDDVLERADLAFAEQDQGVLQDRLHLLGRGDEVGRQKAAIELHAFDHVERGVGGLRFLDRDDALAADLFHGVGDEFADGWIVVGGNRGDLGLFLAARHRPRQLAQRLDGAL